MNFQFVIALLGIAGSFIQSITKNKTADAVGTDIAAIDQATLAVLQQNATIKGASVNWADPTSVSQFMATLPAFTPIAEPPAAPAGPTAVGPAKTPNA